MVLCDTNIFIHAFNGNPATITALTRIGTVRIVLSAITVMELLQGMGNKKELAQKKIKYCNRSCFFYTDLSYFIQFGTPQ
jgi:predicted nucleic acid-binding protein